MNHKKSYELDQYEATDFVPLEYHDSDSENFNNFKVEDDDKFI